MRNGDATCQCGLATRLVGDGCERCNPQLAIQLLKEQVEDMRLTDEERAAVERLCKAVAEYSDIDRKENGCHADDDMAAVAVARGLLKRMV